MGAGDKVQRPSAPIAYISVAGTIELSRLVKSFLEAQGYRVEHLAKHVETKTLKVYND